MGRRKAIDNDESSDTIEVSAPAKRQKRVTVACDSCRNAKAKCNGGQPCNSCITQDKGCTYSHTSRKRGVPTGYIKSLESSLAWLFERYPGSEATLHNHLNKDKAVAGSTRNPRDEENLRLCQKWNGSCIPRDINHILSGSEPRTDTPLAEADTLWINSPTNAMLSELDHNPDRTCGGVEPTSEEIHVQSIQLPESSASSTSIHYLALPPCWERLVDIFFQFTSCWFPIIDHDQVMKTASEYLQEGLQMEIYESSALHAQLWAVLAVASFQDEMTAGTDKDTEFCSGQIYGITCQLINLNSSDIGLPLVRAILLQSLLLLGQQRPTEAWALIAKALRLASVTLPATAACQSNRPGGGSQDLDEASKVIVALTILDTLASLCVGRVHLVASTFQTHFSDTPFTPLLVETTASSVIEHNQGNTCGSSSHIEDPHQPTAVFKQLYTFCRLWALHRSAKQAHPSGREISSEELLQSLDTRFSFCNSLLRNDSTLKLPSMVLLQIMFLAVSLDVVPEPQSTILLQFLELVEKCVQNPPTLSIAPILITLMTIVHQHSHIEHMREDDRLRWNATLTSLKEASQTKESRRGPTLGINQMSHSHDLSDGSFIARSSAGSNLGLQTDAGHIKETNRPGTRDLGAVSENIASHATQPLRQNSGFECPELPPPPDGSSMNIQPRSSSRASIHGIAHEALQNQNCIFLQEGTLDYSLILEELESVQYADPIEADLRVLTNLGFEPGHDLEDIFASNLAD